MSIELSRLRNYENILEENISWEKKYPNDINLINIHRLTSEEIIKSLVINGQIITDTSDEGILTVIKGLINKALNNK